jgi:hypothetical protein
MRNLLRKRQGQLIAFVLLDVVSVGMGMGVPFFTILLGFPVGLFIPAIPAYHTELSPRLLRSIIRISLVISGVTFIILAVLWLPSLSWLFDPARDLSNYGIPMILYEPKASFIGWMVLMVAVSPFLQFLMALFGSITRIVLSPDRWNRRQISTAD